MDRKTEFGDSCLGNARCICGHCNLQIPDSFESIELLSDFLSLDDPCESQRPRTGYIRDQLIGDQLGDFLIQERIGSGGMARVYLAFDTILKRHVAVKVIQNRKVINRESQAELLQAEAISQARLHHPNVVSIFHVGSHDDLPYLAMEYVDGPSLNDRIKEGPIPFEEVWQYTIQIVNGLSEAYRNGLIHGDIKPANLLVDDDNVIKLSDFGLARHLNDEDYQPKLLVGTPSFMAPELFEKHAIDEQTDLYSLGVTLFQLTFGKPPFTLIGETAEEVRLCLENSEIEFPDDCDHIPDSWMSGLKRLLAKSRSERYQDISEFKSDIQFPNSQQMVAKRIPKISSLIVDNLSFLFLCIPLIVLGNGAQSLSIADPAVWISLFGPVAWFALSVMRMKSVGNLITGSTLFHLQSERCRFAYSRFHALSILPAALMLAGSISISAIGASFGLTLISLGLAVLVCLIVDVFVHKRTSTFAEQVCRTRLIVDV